MVHFNGATSEFIDMEKEDKFEYLKNVDLTTTEFQVKIADFGLSTKLEKTESRLTIKCGTPLYMSP